MTERVTFILKYGWIKKICLQQKGHFTHPGQRGWCLSTTRALSVHVPALTIPAFLQVFFIYPRNSRDSQERVVGVSIPDKKLLVWRDSLRKEGTRQLMSMWLCGWCNMTMNIYSCIILQKSHIQSSLLWPADGAVLKGIYIAWPVRSHKATHGLVSQDTRVHSHLRRLVEDAAADLHHLQVLLLFIPGALDVSHPAALVLLAGIDEVAHRAVLVEHLSAHNSEKKRVNIESKL